MLRSLMASVVVALALVPAAGEACEGHSGKAKSARVDAVKPATQTSTSASTGKTQVPAPAPKADSVKPASTDAAKEVQGALLKEVDVLVADKCSCGNAADCTCKKGQCKCKSCKPRRLIERVNGTTDALKLPKEARYEATSGIFI